MHLTGGFSMSGPKGELHGKLGSLMTDTYRFDL